MMFYSYLWGKHCWLKMEWSLCGHNYVPLNIDVLPLFARQIVLTENGMEFMSVIMCVNSDFDPCLLIKHSWLKKE